MVMKKSSGGLLPKPGENPHQKLKKMSVKKGEKCGNF